MKSITVLWRFIWGIADDVLRDIYVRGKYRDVILPMTVIRRLDAVPEPSKERVLAMQEQLDNAGIANQDAALCQASGEAFYNISPFTLRDLKNRAKKQQLKADFEEYLDGFSDNVKKILDKFKFRNQIPTLIETDILGHLLEKFLDNRINLSPKPVQDDEGNELALDNHSMGTIFEELIRRFNEDNNEEAGEHFTPRDVVRLYLDGADRDKLDPIQDEPHQEQIMDVKSAAIQVLKQAGKALHAKDITQQIISDGLWQSAGKTPDATVSARIYSDIKAKGDDSAFVKVGPQVFALRNSGEMPILDGLVHKAVEKPVESASVNHGFYSLNFTFAGRNGF